MPRRKKQPRRLCDDTQDDPYWIEQLVANLVAMPWRFEPSSKEVIGIDITNAFLEMARVLKPEGTIAIGDLTTSEETEKANYQHEMEVLCDPSHARAITLGRFRKLIMESGLEMKGDFQGTQDYDLQEWITHGSPSTEAASRIEELMQRAISQDLCDLNVRMEDGKIRFTHQTALFLATKVPGD